MSTSSTSGSNNVALGAQYQHLLTAPRPLHVFLASIDPKDLEQAALEHAGGLGGPTVGEAFLLALKAMAEDWEGA